jgi:hypothetical protein
MCIIKKCRTIPDQTFMNIIVSSVMGFQNYLHFCPTLYILKKGKEGLFQLYFLTFRALCNVGSATKIATNCRTRRLLYAGDLLVYCLMLDILKKNFFSRRFRVRAFSKQSKLFLLCYFWACTVLQGSPKT